MFEHGADQIDIILNNKPRRGVVSFPIETKNLNFSYQPPLTPQEIAEGAFRPEEIVGSYAIYHKYKCGNEYKTGKVAHLLRPLFIDDAGKKEWGHVRIVDNLLRITDPQKFLDTAKYPILIDPTFGKTDKGGTPVSYGSNVRGSRYTLGSNEDITKITIYFKDVNADEDIRCGIYDVDGANDPKNFLGETQEYTTDGTEDDWFDFPYTIPLPLVAAEYYLCWQIDGGATFYYDGVGEYHTDSVAYPNWNDPFTSDFNAVRSFSIYATWVTPPPPAGGMGAKPPIMELLLAGVID